MTREMEGHVAFVAVAEVGDRVLRPLVRLGEQHPVLVVRVDVARAALQEVVRLGQVLAVRALAFVEVGHGVEAQAVDAHVEPEVERLNHGVHHGGVVEVQIRLVRVEAVPVVRVRHRVPGPVGRLEILEDDARVRVLVRRVAPDVEVAPLTARLRARGPLKPRVLVRRVVDRPAR